MLSTLRSDVTVALRTMVRQPVFTAAVVATLAIGIGANTAMFALVHAALLKPLPYRNPDRLVLARRTVPSGFQMWNSALDYYDYRDQTPGLEALAACGPGSSKVTVTGGARPERVPMMTVSHNLFGMLGVAPVAGRLFTLPEGRTGAPYVAVVSARLAEHRFGSTGAAVGQTLALAGLRGGAVSATIVGVLSSEFRFLDAADIWVPIREGEDDGPETRQFHNWVLIGRLKDGVSMATAQSQLDVVSHRLQQMYPATNKVTGLRIDPLQATLLQEQTPRLMVLTGAIGLVLLIACTNVAGMLLTRGVARRPELAVRAALGASRGRIAAQLLTESMVISLAAGALGLVLAIWLRHLLPIATGLADAGISASGVEGRVLWFALAVSVGTGVLCGVAPAWRASPLRLMEHLVPGARATDSPGGARLRSVLVTAQVALSLVLLVGAGLLVRSLVGLMTTDLGFEAKNLLTTTIDLPRADESARLQFQTLLHDDLAAIPGVKDVAFTSHTPILEPWSDPPVWAADHPPLDSSQERTAYRRWVTPGFFETLGIRVMAGRDLSTLDRIGTPRVAVINDAFARGFFPGEDALGKRVIVAGGPQPLDYLVVGVVSNARTEGVGDGANASVYLSANQRPLAEAKVLIRSTVAPEQLTRAVRKAVAARDSDIPVDALTRMDALIADSLVSERVTTVTLTAFSVLALLLAALGLYGVLTHYVAQKRHEIAVRMALGAVARQLVRHVLWRSARMVVPGLAVGVVASLAGSTLIREFLYGVQPTDPVTFASVTLALLLVALAASVWPAWRAARVDPLRALRGE